MKASDPTELKKIQPPHLSYSAFCLAPRLRTTCFLKLTSSAKSSNCFCPVKQKRALLKSNSPRDNWTEGDEIIRLHIWGAKNSPNLNLETFISEPSHALENLEYPARSESNSTEQTNKNTLSRCPFFRGKRMIHFREIVGNSAGFDTPAWHWDSWFRHRKLGCRHQTE